MTNFKHSLNRFGKDFDLGWVGFVHSNNLLSQTIAYLTRGDKTGETTVSHTFLVTGQDECVEANYPVGVVETRLSEAYLGRPDRQVVFRRPKELTQKVANRLVKRAKAQVGSGFDYGVFAASGLRGTFLGHLANTLFHDKPQDWVDQMLNRDDRWICSELVVYCLQKEARYRGQGVLSHSPGTVTPQQLFEDDEVFEPLR